MSFMSISLLGDGGSEDECGLSPLSAGDLVRWVDFIEGDCGLGIGVGKLTSTLLEELQWFNFFLRVGLTDILATFEGLGKDL
ncbi:hypothetical protein Tco_0803412 [Tanacetum coccineum]|uniref:Uncharacterized protein n=1 Tax=Tanacetum coccineum TaxID=301880 RepID=A0ABQ5A1H8_9ASTR